VEHLAKAVLMSKNPVLLLDLRSGKRSTEMLYHLTGMKDVNVEKVWTIGAAEAVSRLRDLGVLSCDSTLDRLVELRNGVAHFNGEDITDDLLPTFVNTVGVLLSHAAVDDEEFWGTWSPAAKVATNEADNKVLQDVRLRIQNAKDLYVSRTSMKPDKGMQEDERDECEKSELWYGCDLVTQREDYMEIVRGVACPACGQWARLQSIILTEEIAEDCAIFTSEQVFCNHCRLRLTGPEEIEAGGLDPALEVSLNGGSLLGSHIRDRDKFHGTYCVARDAVVSAILGYAF